MVPETPPDEEAGEPWTFDLEGADIEGAELRSARSDARLADLSLRIVEPLRSEGPTLDLRFEAGADLEGLLANRGPADLSPGAVRLEGRLAGGLSLLIAELRLTTEAGALRLDAAVSDLVGEQPRYRLDLASDGVLQPGAILATIAPETRGGLTVGLRGEGNPLEAGFAQGAVSLSDLRVPSLPLPPRLVLDLRAEAGAVDAELCALGADGERLQLSAHSPWLPPGPLHTTVRVRDLPLGSWAELLGRPAAGGTLERLVVDADLALADGEILGADGRVELALRDLRGPKEAPIHLQSLKTEAQLGWAGEGLPPAASRSRCPACRAWARGPRGWPWTARSGTARPATRDDFASRPAIWRSTKGGSGR